MSIKPRQRWTPVDPVILETAIESGTTQRLERAAWPAALAGHPQFERAVLYVEATPRQIPSSGTSTPIVARLDTVRRDLRDAPDLFNAERRYLVRLPTGEVLMSAPVKAGLEYPHRSPRPPAWGE